MTTTTPPQNHISESMTIDAAELRELLARDPAIRILDVRTGGEFDGAHIPGSYNVPLDTLGEHTRDLADVEHPVVLVCKSGARAGKARVSLTSAGKQNLHLLGGGIDAWQAAGGDVTRGTNEKWALDRQVRLVAGSMSLIALIVSIFFPKAKWVAAGVAAGLTFSAVSNTCTMGNILAKLPYNRSDNCDIEGVLKAMQA